MDSMMFGLPNNVYTYVIVGTAALAVLALVIFRGFTVYGYLLRIWSMVMQWRVARFFLFLVAALKWLLMQIFRVAATSSSPPRPCFDDILLRCLRSCAQRKSLQIHLPRSPDVFAQLRSLPFFDSLRRTSLESYMYMVCNPANKEENLSKALLHFLYNRLCIEAMSKSFSNPDGSFDLLAECPDLAKTPGLKEFPDLFKTIKDVAVKEVFESVANVDQLSDVQCDLVMELIKMVMIKKAYEDLEGFEASIGRTHLHKLIDQMARNKFLPSNKDMLKLVSKSLSTSVHVLAPDKKVAKKDVYGRHTIKKTCTTVIPISLEPLILYEQKDDSYVLTRPPKLQSSRS